MNTHTDKTQENKTQSVSNGMSQMQSGGESTFQFVDNRPEAVAQRKLKEMANNSSQAMQLKAFQEMTKNSPQAKQAAQLQAHAYAQGTDIHLGTGQEKHLPHEAWHVVQQKQGRVKPTMQMKDKVNVNDDSSLEREADVMGAKALTNTTQIDSVDRKYEVAKNIVLQAVWSQSPFHEEFYQWHEAINGMRWYVSKISDDMYFVMEHLSEETRPLMIFQKQIKPYDFWLGKGFIPLDADNSVVDEVPDKAPVPVADYTPFLVKVVGHKINEDGTVEPRTSNVSRMNQKGFEREVGAPSAGGISVGYGRENAVGSYVFHLTTLRNMLTTPEASDPGSGVQSRGLDPGLGGGSGGASETSEVTGDDIMISGSHEHSRRRVATTTSQINLKLYTNQRLEFTEMQFGQGLYGDFDLVEREPVLLRFRVTQEHIGAMEIDPMHPKDKYVRLIQDIAITPDELEVLTSEGWVTMGTIDIDTLLEVMPRIQ